MTRSTSIFMSAFVAFAVAALCFSPHNVAAQGSVATALSGAGGTGGAEDDAAAAAEKARQEAIADLKRQMQELQNYDPGKDPAFNGLSTAEKKEKFVELINNHAKRIKELQSNEYYNDDSLVEERSLFEKNLEEFDPEEAKLVETMSDEVFEEFLSDSDDEDEDLDAEEKSGDGEPDKNGGGEDDEDFGDGESWEGPDDNEALSRQPGLKEALGAFGGAGDIGGAFSQAAALIGKIPGWDKFNGEIDKMNNLLDKGWDAVLAYYANEEGQDTSNGSTKKQAQTTTTSAIKKIVPQNATAKTVTKASSLLMASDGTILIDDEPMAPTITEEEPATVLDDASYGSLEWKFGKGRVKGEGADAAFDSESDPVIGNLQIKGDGLSFDYEKDLSSWGMDYTDHSGAVACLFVLDNDGNWVGGTFEFISSSRNKRSFDNINSGDRGWNLSNVPNPTTAAFVIVSTDGKHRSNVVTAIWER